MKTISALLISVLLLAGTLLVVGLERGIAAQDTAVLQKVDAPANAVWVDSGSQSRTDTTPTCASRERNTSSCDSAATSQDHARRY